MSKRSTNGITEMLVTPCVIARETICDTLTLYPLLLLAMQQEDPGIYYVHAFTHKTYKKF